MRRCRPESSAPARFSPGARSERSRTGRDHLPGRGLDGLLPVWVRNLAYRLITLQRPEDVALLREAALSLYAYGPTWDADADALTLQADELEGKAAAAAAGS
ncbi:hypothetical protein ACE1OC_15155 [Streptomyces sp. DSM 116496]|uniref:hypothetical protein n=1 Tax=Streptomyces stoeckheimensis TaxID=3344656 RepID=UPI0038B36920